MSSAPVRIHPAALEEAEAVTEWYRQRSTRFPYLVDLRETAAGVEIIAVARGRRRPGYWRDRAE